jgi:hypothetical protein
VRFAAPMPDRISVTNESADANIDRQKAERIAIDIFDGIHYNNSQQRAWIRS